MGLIMSASTSPHKLHLPDLAIQGFCGIRDLTINRLGRVTLIAGMNGVGKTTLLDAVCAYAERGRQSTLQDILSRRHEMVDDVDVDGKPVALLDWSALFFGRCLDEGRSISIGPRSPAPDQQLLLTLERDQQAQEIHWNSDERDISLFIESKFAKTTRPIQIGPSPPLPPYWTTAQIRQRERQLSHGALDPVVCRSLGPDLPNARLITDLWQGVALRAAEADAIDALNLLTANDQTIERVAVIESERGTFSPTNYPPVRT